MLPFGSIKENILMTRIIAWRPGCNYEKKGLMQPYALSAHILCCWMIFAQQLPWQPLCLHRSTLFDIIPGIKYPIIFLAPCSTRRWNLYTNLFLTRNFLIGVVAQRLAWKDHSSRRKRKCFVTNLITFVLLALRPKAAGGLLQDGLNFLKFIQPNFKLCRY